MAWEYGREYLKDFNSWHVYRSFLKRNSRCVVGKSAHNATVFSHTLNRVFLTFWKSPLWPDSCFQDLTIPEKKQAFPLVFNKWEEPARIDITDSVQDITPRNPWILSEWKKASLLFDEEEEDFQDILGTTKKVFLLNIEKGSQALLHSFKQRLINLGLVEGRGRSPLIKDLLALSIFRLFQRFKNFEQMDVVLGAGGGGRRYFEEKIEVRKDCYCHALSRLGILPLRSKKTWMEIRPVFEFR